MGFDLDGEQLAAGRARALRRLRFELGDATRLEDVDDGAFDRAVCQALLVHQARPQEVLATMARVVQPGGRIAAIEPDFTRDPLGPAEGLVEGTVLARRAEVRGALAEAVGRLGLGSWAAGARLEALFAGAGLRVLARWAVPTVQRVGEDAAGRAWASELEASLRPEAIREELAPLADLFLQGGGSPERWAQHAEDEATVATARRAALRSGAWDGRWSPPLRVCVGVAVGTAPGC